MKPANPFHVYPIWKGDLQASKAGHYYSPPNRAVRWQFAVPSESALTVSFYEIVTEGGTVYTLDETLIDVLFYALGDTCLFTDSGAEFGFLLANGTHYRPRITLSNGAAYYGHLTCANYAFASDAFTLSILSCAVDGLGVSTVTIASNAPADASVAFTALDAYSSHTQSAGGTLAISSADLTASGGNFRVDITATITVTALDGSVHTQVLDYRLSASSGDVCGAAVLTFRSSSVTPDEGTATLTIFGDDVKSQNIYYGGGYQQKLYLQAHESNPRPVISEQYLENGEGETTFQSALVGEQRVIEFFPSPDRIATGLAAAKYAKFVYIQDVTGTEQYYRITFEAIEVDGVYSTGGRLLAEPFPAFTQAYNEQYE